MLQACYRGNHLGLQIRHNASRTADLLGTGESRAWGNLKEQPQDTRNSDKAKHEYHNMTQSSDQIETNKENNQNQNTIAQQQQQQSEERQQQ